MPIHLFVPDQGRNVPKLEYQLLCLSQNQDLDAVAMPACLHAGFMYSCR